MIDGLINCKLYGTAQRRTGQSRRAFVTAKVRAASDGDTLFVNIITFSDSTSAPPPQCATRGEARTGRVAGRPIMNGDERQRLNAHHAECGRVGAERAAIEAAAFERWRRSTAVLA
ncbi:hypothetical protein [Paraburkholderia tagetis]|uniref:Single-stranded DNA-binding protein n=1 Tax=Paraburkholderia tagetis TaxID=2913261 RepID=A0A9X1UGV1_9BURK|nr:hypothetical protein [Paraburkholderia tagetis]MCG5073027.1 hypothetical protein [Paraburkholderia tagetis]